MKSRIEMHLESTQEQDVSIQHAELDLHFTRCETIHTENSYKFTGQGIRSLLNDAGFEVGRAWKDTRKLVHGHACVPLIVGFVALIVRL